MGEQWRGEIIRNQKAASEARRLVLRPLRTELVRTYWRVDREAMEGGGVGVCPGDRPLNG